MQVRIAFIGCGRMASAHATALNKIEGITLHGAYDIIPERGKAFAEKFSVKKVYRSREELLKDSEVTAIAICDYGHQHAEELLTAMQAGCKRIFCEKPAIRQFAEAGPILKTAKKTGSLVCIGQVRRYFPEQIKMKEIIDSGILGRILFAKAHCCVNTFTREWGGYFASFEQSGGTTLDMGVHYMDLFNWFFGQPKNTSARLLGMEKALSPEEKPCDYFSGNILYENGIICGLETAYQRHGARADLIEVYGDQNTLVVDRGQVRVYNRDSFTEYSITKNDPHEQQMRAFVRMIQDGTPCACMLEDGILASEVALAMLEASNTGKYYEFNGINNQ